MDKTKEILDELAAKNALWHSTARKAQAANLSKLKTLPPEELEEYFVALCRTEGEYDRKLRVRRCILPLLPDIRLINLLDVRMPVQLAHKISKRLCPKDDKSLGPSTVYNDDFTEDS
jgi:hypothetical protein